MATNDFIRDKLTEWGFTEFLQRFKDEHIDKESFLSLGSLDSISVLIPKIGPRVKFRKRLKEYLQWNSMETCYFVQDKLTEWGLSELIQIFEDQAIDKETFLSLEELGNFNDLIPKTGPRVKFRKRLREYLQAQNQTHADIPEMLDTGMDTYSDQEDSSQMAQIQTQADIPEMPDTETDTNSDQEDIPEMDPTILPWHFEPTSTSDTDCVMSEETVSNSNSSAGLLAVILFILRHSVTAALDDFMALWNFLSPILIVASESISDKIAAVSTVFYCHDCQNYMGENPHDAPCPQCGKMFNKKRSTRGGHFFLFTSVKVLLKDILQNHGTKLLSKTVKHGHDIKDVMDGKMYQTLLEQGGLAADDITLTWNSDGVPIYESPTYSIWPLQFTINELPYMQRKENVIVAGLWFGQTNPNMKTFLKPFTDECLNLANNPIQWRDSNGKDHSSKVFCLVCSSDAVARPLLRNCKQFNGQYGCDWCLHPGESIKKCKGHTRSYPYDKIKQAPRSNEMFGNDAEEAESSNTPKNGVKGSSLLSKLPLFDIVFGFVPDYLHSVLRGVSKQLMSLWLDPVNSMKQWYVGEQIEQMDSRLRRLNSPLEKNKNPRSLKCWDVWNPSEWRAFLLFYAISVLPGILPPEYLKHYLYLVSSIHILLQETISPHDLTLAHEYLIHFVKDMEVLYGQENVSFNCHQLIHLTESVVNWGPLWATSTFSFERNNGHLRDLVSGMKFDPRHIYKKFLIWHHIPRDLTSSVFNRQSDFGELLAKLTPANDGRGSDKPLGNSHHPDLTGSTKLAVEELLNRSVPTKSLEACDSFTYGNTVYHSTSLKESDQNSCIGLHNGCYGEIQQIFLFKDNCVCTSNCLCQAIPIIVVQMYVNAGTFSHPSKTVFVKVKKTDELKAFFLVDIRCKCIHVDGWFVPLPNTYERY